MKMFIATILCIILIFFFFLDAIKIIAIFFLKIFWLMLNLKILWQKGRFAIAIILRGSRRLCFILIVERKLWRFLIILD